MPLRFFASFFTPVVWCGVEALLLLLRCDKTLAIAKPDADSSRTGVKGQGRGSWPSVPRGLFAKVQLLHRSQAPFCSMLNFNCWCWFWRTCMSPRCRSWTNLSNGHRSVTSRPIRHLVRQNDANCPCLVSLSFQLPDRPLLAVCRKLLLLFFCTRLEASLEKLVSRFYPHLFFCTCLCVHFRSIYIVWIE